jgi:hypothetical protein
MKLLFIYGLPATGKLSVAKELAAMTGFKLFHNHLVIDALLPVFEFGSRPFIELREEFWLSTFRQACRHRLPGLVFTFAPEPTVRAEFVQNATQVVEVEGGEIIFVQLTCPLPELKARLANPSRIGYGKLTSIPLFEQLYADGIFDCSHMPVPRVTLDTSLYSPAESARRIARALGLNITNDDKAQEL